eukprot:scaffold26053_cov146-Isochrysis_galbana.AAC.3
MLVEAQTTRSLLEAFSSGDISVLYKKADTRDVRNYRPLGLLQLALLKWVEMDRGLQVPSESHSTRSG